VINLKVDTSKYEKAYEAFVGTLREFISGVARRDNRQPATRSDLDEPPDMLTPTGRVDRLPE